MLNFKKWRSYNLRLIIEEVVLLSILCLVSVITTYVIFGDIFSALFSMIIPILFTFHLKNSSQILLRYYRARQLDREDFDSIYSIVDDLSVRASLDQRPRLYFLDTFQINAFTADFGEYYGIAISRGLINTMQERELKAVLAHEISHISNRDPLFLKVTTAIYSFISFVSTAIHIILILCLPFYLLNLIEIRLQLAFAIIFSPWILRFLILAIMRNREYKADLNASLLTQDPLGLAMALRKLLRLQGRFLNLFFPFRPNQKTSMLDTHPTTTSRISRLLDLEKRM
ncbi:zinc metalloprotease HtpX [Halobacteriovorax sp. GB3]|uniref:zinc metalloprotease HtpX n=1 Tax=Halobacteriovorax sp. GB3 TaxID=2719615 RepID=UPI00235E1177|nr:zinc metalloprotease HtpX [Halobacteriovorax sp. GB3]MDD0851886.1 zinc metalloprotease HtpX [Halobacteriovorax sp. GB3]